MSPDELLHHYLDQCPLVAIIRGVTPAEAEEIGDAIFEAGIRIIEVPLNSPQPLESIGRLAKRLGDRMLVGAGTVLDSHDVVRIGDVGGRIIVSPDTNTQVIEATARAGLVSSPGYSTPSEAFARDPRRRNCVEAVPRRSGEPGSPAGAPHGPPQACSGAGRRRDQARQYAPVARKPARAASVLAGGFINRGKAPWRRWRRRATMSQD